jgi:hypothetical protein
MPRRLPAPWRVERIPGGYVVCDANDQNLAYVYSRANEAEALQAKEAGAVLIAVARKTHQRPSCARLPIPATHR